MTKDEQDILELSNLLTAALKKEEEAEEEKKFDELSKKYAVKKGANYWRDMARALAYEYAPNFKVNRKGAPLKWHPFAQGMVVVEMERFMNPESGEKVSVKSAAWKLLKEERWQKFIGGKSGHEALKRAYSEYKDTVHAKRMRKNFLMHVEKNGIKDWELVVDLTLRTPAARLNQFAKVVMNLNPKPKNGK